MAVLTVSDGVAAGVREDLSGEVAAEELRKLGFDVVTREVVSDDKAQIVAWVRLWADGGEAELVVTTGGTGLGPRDVTPEAIRPILDREIPGYGELPARRRLAPYPHGGAVADSRGHPRECSRHLPPGEPQGGARRARRSRADASARPRAPLGENGASLTFVTEPAR